MGEVAKRLCKYDRTIQKWLRWYRKGGVEELNHHLPTGPGAPPKMNAERISALKQHLNQGTTRTIEQVSQYVKATFGVVFNRKYFQQWLARHRIVWKVPRPSNLKQTLLHSLTISSVECFDEVPTSILTALRKFATNEQNLSNSFPFFTEF